MNLLLSILITLFLIGVLLSIVYIIVGFILEKKAKKTPVEEKVDTSNVPYLKQEESQQEKEQPIAEEEKAEEPAEETPAEEPVAEEPKEEKKAPRKRASSKAKAASKEDKKED